nr:unnamed protein product [Meloidogyne enterolobii]
MAATQKNVGFGQTTESQRTLASSTPGGASTTTTEMNTPFRDQLNINPISDETRPSKKNYNNNSINYLNLKMILN